MNVAELRPWPVGAPIANEFCGEDERLAILASYGLGELEGDAELAEITRFAADLCKASISMVSLVKQDEQVFIATNTGQQDSTPRNTSFCARAMLKPEITVIPDARLHPEFRNFTLVVGPPYIRFYAGMPLVSPEGAPLGALCVIDAEPRPEGLDEMQQRGLGVLGQAVMRRLQSRRVYRGAQSATKENERRFRKMVDSLPEITWSANAKGEITYINRRWREYTGLPHDDFDSDHIRSAYHPDEVGPWRDDWLEALRKGEPYEGEYRLRHADGSFGWILARALPIRDEDGEITSWFGQLIDIDEQHRYADTRDLLTRELSHRIKNMFAVVNSLISLRSRNHPELGDFAEQLIDVIAALGRAQGYVRPTAGEEQHDLAEMLDLLTEPYGEDGSRRVHVDGLGTRIGPRTATPIALIFHELATNSIKYGALSEPSGRVDIRLSKQEDRIVVRWQESGGPTVTEPVDIGFGSRLLETTIRSQLRGTLERAWKPSGLQVTMTLPLAAIAN